MRGATCRCRSLPLACAWMLLLLVACDRATGEAKTEDMVLIDTNLRYEFGAGRQCGEPDLGALCAAVADDFLDLRGFSKPYPSATVNIRPFMIDAAEVTNRQFAECVDAGVCWEPSGEPGTIVPYYDNEQYRDYPVLNISRDQAQAYCASQGKRLPTQFEWERVAIGPEAGNARQYPFDGSPTASSPDQMLECRDRDFPLEMCSGDKRPRKVGESVDDRVSEAHGTVRGLLGNVSEWVLDSWDPGFTCAELLSCPDCWRCVGGECVSSCLACDQCRAAESSCFVICEEVDFHESSIGIPVCMKFPEELYCSVNEQMNSVCCLGSFEDAGGTACRQARSFDQKYAYRGGNYLTSDDEYCEAKSAERTRGLNSFWESHYVGFRCARSLNGNSHPEVSR